MGFADFLKSFYLTKPTGKLPPGFPTTVKLGTCQAVPVSLNQIGRSYMIAASCRPYHKQGEPPPPTYTQN